MPAIIVRSREDFRRHLETRYEFIQSRVKTLSHPERRAKEKGLATGMAECLLALEQWESNQHVASPEQDAFLIRCLRSRTVLDSTLVHYEVSFVEACEFWGCSSESKLDITSILKGFRILLAECNLLITRQEQEEIILSNRRSVNILDIERIGWVDTMLRSTFERPLRMLSRRKRS